MVGLVIVRMDSPRVGLAVVSPSMPHEPRAGLDAPVNTPHDQMKEIMARRAVDRTNRTPQHPLLLHLVEGRECNERVNVSGPSCQRFVCTLY